MASPNPRTDAQLVTNHSVGATVQVVIDSLFARIQSEEYPEGARLPSERTLSTELGVARNTVREALDVLESRHIIRRRAGSGSFVTYKTQHSRIGNRSALAENISPLDHLVVRGILEPEMIRLAVIHMTPRDIMELDDILSRMEAISTDAAAFVKCEEDFYRKIATGTGNPLLASCYDLAIDACMQTFRSRMMRRHLTPRRIEDYQKRYNALFNTISSRDVETAVEYIKLHLIEEQKTLLQED
ncbi:FCD domain-containing protein [uncultured Roseovarius sp.]|uniref:FadR/GntR family transcriptional regulator n=1 Tax=uncultured Roseovarius sp. TaxID=293344 RepID=UPI0026138781|nr:FCD domain-containing protein [uncultured Roseovarius sp.]